MGSFMGKKSIKINFTEKEKKGKQILRLVMDKRRYGEGIILLLEETGPIKIAINQLN